MGPQEVTRRPWIALLLGFTFPGWGHLYVGRVRRFLGAAVALLAFALLLAAFGALSTFEGMATYLVAVVLFIAFAGIDPAVQARVAGAGPRRRWYVYLAWWIGVSLFWWIWVQLREPVLGYGVFRVLTDSMTPAVNNREIVLVDTRAYGQRLPVVGDVIVVDDADADAGKRYVRRVVSVGPQAEVAVAADRPGSDAAPRAYGAGQIVGRATCVLFSPTPGRTGKPVS